MTENVNDENNKNENNIPLNKNDEEMKNLLKKLNNDIEINKKRSILNLPSYNLELDLDLDFVDAEEEKKEIININKAEENNDKKENKNEEINIDIINTDNQSEKNEEKLKNKNIKDTEDLNSQNKNDINISNNNDSRMSNNDNKNNTDIKNNNDISKENKEEINDNKILNEENNISKKDNENENNKKKESENDFNLILSDEEKEKEKEKEKELNNKKEENIINNDINQNKSINSIQKNENNNSKDEKNIEKEKDKNKEENNNRSVDFPNVQNSENKDKKEGGEEINSKNSDSNYEECEQNIDEFEQDDFKKNNNNKKINENEENKDNQIDNSKNDLDMNKNNENNNDNKINDINDNKSNNKNEEKKNKKDNIDIYSDLQISEKEEDNQKKSEKSENSKNKDNPLKSQEINNSTNNNKLRDSQEDIPQETNMNKINSNENNNQENNAINANGNKSVDDLSVEQKTSLKNIVEKITDFRNQKQEINKDELEKFQTINLDFNYKEKSLGDLIPSLKSKIEDNETSNEVEKRKHDFLEHIYFEGGISTNPLLDLVSYCKISHNDLMNNIYNEQGLKLKNVQKISDENYKNKIFKSGVGEAKINRVENLENFLYKYRLENNKKISMKSYKYFPFWRNVEGDGNSFFRTTMFAIIENFIIKKSIEDLNLIISEISCDRFIKIYKENNINYELAFYIFGVILHLLEDNKIEEAYSLFVQSYSLKDDSFDKILIIYLRNICYDYTDEALELSKDEEVEKQIQIQTQFINKELIKTMNVEPDFFVVCLIPYLFDFNLTIYWIDQDLLKPKEGLIKFADEESPEPLPFITIGYFYSSYHRIYPKQWYEEENQVQNIFNNEISDIKNLTYDFKSIKKCNICKKDIFTALLEKKIKICKNCLNEYINEISNERREALIKDDYIGKEYYSRPMKLSKDIYLNDFEFIEIKEEYNMINYLQQKLSVNCSKCKNFFTKRNLNNLKCKCLLCDKCLDELIIQITDGKKILNKYEKLNLDKIQCPICSGNFSYEDAIEHLKDIKESDKDNAINRMREYASTLCLICGEKVREKNDNLNQDDLLENNNIKKNEEVDKRYNEIKKYKTVNLKREGERNKGIDYIDTEHVICFNCFEKNKIKKILDDSSYSGDDEDNSEKKFFINLEKGNCFCRICYKKHNLLEKAVKNGACCTTSFCSLL